MQAKRFGGILGAAVAASVLVGGGAAQAGPWIHVVPGVHVGPFYGGPYLGPGYVQPFVQPYVPQPVFVQPTPVIVPQPVYVPTVRVVGPVTVPHAVTGMADLAVISFQPVGVRNDAGILKTTLEFEIRNVGTGPAAPTLTSVQLDYGPYYYARTQELQPGESAHLSVEVNGTLRIGTRIRIHADHQNQLEEIRKTNNRLDMEWTG
jgi:CARDB